MQQNLIECGSILIDEMTYTSIARDSFIIVCQSWTLDDSIVDEGVAVMRTVFTEYVLNSSLELLESIS